MADCSTTFAALVLFALSTVGCRAGRADRADVQILAAEQADNDMAGDFMTYDGKFEKKRQDKAQQYMEVKQLKAVSDNMLRSTFKSSLQDGSGMDIASKDIHVAIAAEMLDNLKKKHAKVMDLGSGTGALMAIFIELVAPNCNGCTVEGIEYDQKTAQWASKWMSILHEFPGLEEAAQVGKTVHVGNAFAWNPQGGTYHVINVGFAVVKDTLDGTPAWKAALAEDGGKLIVPLCTTTPPELNNGRCKAKFHVFTRTQSGEIHEETWSEDVNFVYVGPS